MSNAGEPIVTVAVAIIGVATLAVIVGRYSNTANVITATGKAFASVLQIAVSPVTGGAGGSSMAGGASVMFNSL